MPRLDTRTLARKLAASGAVKAATLIKLTASVRAPDALSAGANPTSASYACRAIATSTKREKIAGTLVQATDRVVAVLAATVASAQVPTTKDRLTIDGATLRIIAVEHDPFAAVYTCLCRE